jgi:hypothetical protein
MLGILVSWASYRQYFPPVSETWRKGRAYPIRAWGRGADPPPDSTPTIMVDEDVQPLRPMGHPSDAERGESSGYSSNTAVEGESSNGANVFRQQISDSQRKRQNPYAVDRSDTIASSNYRSDTMGSTISTKVTGYRNSLPKTNPFAGQRRTDTYDYSSSEDGASAWPRHRHGLPPTNRHLTKSHPATAGRHGRFWTAHCGLSYWRLECQERCCARASATCDRHNASANIEPHRFICHICLAAHLRAFMVLCTRIMLPQS